MINGRDHIKIIAKAEVGKGKEAYARLCEIHNLLGGKVNFAKDKKLGYVCSDLKNLGNGFGVELAIPNDKPVAVKEIQEVTPQVRVVKEKDIIKIKGKSIFGTAPAKVIEAAYQVIATLKK